MLVVKVFSELKKVFFLNGETHHGKPSIDEEVEKLKACPEDPRQAPKMISYGEWYWILDLQRRFIFGTRDQALSLKSFCEAEFY